MMYVTHSPATASAQCSCTVAMSWLAPNEAAAVDRGRRAVLTRKAGDEVHIVYAR
ncbi:hypothetical protein ACTJK4_19120 [Ralstonia sp. 22111]|uniref:hypothetical protein n=1 Tax=Ralstonia sp. 22111 TaxID=3453878 RepID=UPI003F8567FE